jgi:serine/threonine protein kinase
MWSLGIVFFILVTGKSPYQGSDNKLIVEQVKDGQVLMSSLTNSKKQLSKACIKLVQRILVKNPR